MLGVVGLGVYYKYQQRPVVTKLTKEQEQHIVQPVTKRDIDPFVMYRDENQV